MQRATSVQQLMPLLREFGSLERKRVGDGVEPLEYQRWLDLKQRMGKRFARSRAEGLAALGGEAAHGRPTRLRVAFKNRGGLLEAIVDNIVPAGFFVTTPFAAEVGTKFLARILLEQEKETADIPVTVVTSMCESGHSRSSMSMGMGVKIGRPTPEQAAGISRLFAGAFDSALGLDSAIPVGARSARR